MDPLRSLSPDRRQSLFDGLHDREEQRADAIEQLQAIQPVLDAAWAAWEPYARRIRDLEHELETELRASMWSANHDARQAEFGHRRHTERVAADASNDVEQAKAAIAAIHADGAPVEQHLHQLRRQTTLRTRAEPIEALDTCDRNEIRQLDQILDAADTYTGWLEGRPTPTARLAHAVTTLTTVASSAPAFARHTCEVDQTQWYKLLDLASPLRELDREQATPELQLER